MQRAYLWDAATTQSGGGRLEVPATNPASDFYITVGVAAIHSRAHKQGLMFCGVDFANFYMLVLDQNRHHEIGLLQGHRGRIRLAQMALLGSGSVSSTALRSIPKELRLPFT